MEYVRIDANVLENKFVFKCLSIVNFKTKYNRLHARWWRKCVFVA